MNESPNILSSVNTAARGMRVAQLAMDTASGNIANASTPNYGRADLRILAGGVDHVMQDAQVGRAEAPLAEHAMHDAHRLASFSDARHGFLSAQVARVLGDMSEHNLGHNFAAFFDAWRHLSANPDSVEERQIILSRADALCGQLQSTARSLESQQTQLDQEVQHLLAGATDKLASVAGYNQRIRDLAAQKRSTVDLENRRADAVDALVGDLGLEVARDADGATRLFAAGGISVVSGDTFLPVSTRLDPTTGFHHVVVDPSLDSNLDRFVGGGRLGAMLTTRDGDLAGFVASLDQLAADLAQAVNTQHQLGFGLDTLGARDFFTTPPAPVAGFARTIALSPSVAGQPRAVAAASSATNALPSETVNAEAIAALDDQALATGGTETFAEALRGIATEAGLVTARAQAEAAQRHALLESARAVRDAQIGVSQEQQIMLMREAQAVYQAGLKVVDMQFRAIDSLLALGR